MIPLEVGGDDFVSTAGSQGDPEVYINIVSNKSDRAIREQEIHTADVATGEIVCVASCIVGKLAFDRGAGVSQYEDWSWLIVGTRNL